LRKFIVNATVVGVEKVLPRHRVLIQDDRIVSVLPMEAPEGRGEAGATVRIDAGGAYLLPGLIDIHSDYIEGLIQPRPTCLMDFSMGLAEAEKQLLAHGITTVYHSLSLMNGAGGAGRRSFRNRENLERLAGLIRDIRRGRHLIRHRFHARYEIDNLEVYDYLARLIGEGRVQELSFMDHTPGQGQYRDLSVYAASYGTWDAACSEKTLEEILAGRDGKPVASHEMLKRLSALARARGIPLASHDDDSVEKVAFMKNEYGASISEFPVDIAAARKAREEGLHVVMGAPNVILGGSHSGNLSALDAIREGCVDILCSDYYPAALLHAAFRLEDGGLLSLPEAVRMLTLNPARAVGIDGDYGSVEAGKKADLIFVRKVRGRPLLSACFINGRRVLSFSYRRDRLKRPRETARVCLGALNRERTATVPAETAVLELRGLGKDFVVHSRGGATLSGFSGVSFQAKAGALLAITGPSGIGKSSLLKCVYRTYIPVAGSILYRTKSGGNVDLARATDWEILELRRDEIAYVSQFFRVMPRLSALEILMEPLLVRGKPAAEARSTAEYLLARAGLGKPLRDMYPATFSGGEKQRLNILRAIITGPRLLLLDEPTSSLDRGCKENIMEMILALKAEGTAMVAVFHDRDAMLRLADTRYDLAANTYCEVERPGADM
jgi:alpha-D-ribose 1-methylphosphonate 5-triphosphate diphosphatase